MRVPACVRDGWVGWTLDGEDRPSVPCAWQLLAAGAASTAARMGWDERWSCSGHVFGGDGTMVLLVSGGGLGGSFEVGGYLFFCLSSLEC